MEGPRQDSLKGNIIGGVVNGGPMVMFSKGKYI